MAVAFDEDATTVDDLVAVIEAVEQEQDVATEESPADRPEHPGDVEQWRRDLLALGADAGALVLTSIGRAARIVRLRPKWPAWWRSRRASLGGLYATNLGRRDRMLVTG